MNKPRSPVWRLFGGVALPVAFSLVGCAGGDVPDKPSFSRDVQPILAAQCYRCHDGLGYPAAGSNEYLAGYHVSMVVPFKTESEANAYAAVISNCVHGRTCPAPPPATRMPPPPAAPLDTWQIQTIDNWSNDVKAGTIIP